MKTLKTIVFTLIFVFSYTTTQAQFFKKLKERAKEKIEREAERRAQRRVDRKIDKTFDNAESKMDKVGKKKSKKSKKTTNKQNSDEQINEQNQQDEQTNALSGMLGDMMSGKEVKTNSSYTFAITATIQVTDFSKKNGKPIQVKQSYGKEALMSQMEEPQKMTMITDLQNQAAIMLDQQAKTARVMSMAWMKKMMQKEDTNNTENTTVKMVKTGKTKTLNGYKCYQYIITDEDVKIDAWFAPKVNFDYQDYLSGMNKMFGNKKTNAASLLNKGKGYVMEMLIYNKGKKQSEMKVTHLSETPITIKMSDYTIEKMF